MDPFDGFYEINEKIDNKRLDEKSTKQSSLTQMTDCKHVSKEVWNSIFRSLEFSDKTLLLLFIDKFNAKPLYVPSFDFQYGFEHNEFSEWPPFECTEEEFDQWFGNNLKDKTQYLRIHVCNAHEIIRKLVVKCNNLRRISFHFYIMNKDCIQSLVKSCQSLEAINFENSIGVHLKSCELLAKLPNLKYLNFSGSDIYEESLKAILKNCRSLESLNISNNCGITGDCLVSVNPLIKRIDLRDCWRIESKQLVAMAQSKLKSLIEFLANSGITDESLIEICTHCPNIIHLNISFDDFTFSDAFGRKVLTDPGFSSIGKLENLQTLTLRHIGKLTDTSMQNILKGCLKLTQLTLNIRHRHQLTDIALTNIGNWCQDLRFLESVHNHFIGKLSLINIAQLNNLETLILRGDELVNDAVIKVLNECKSLLYINLDGCDVGEPILKACVERAKLLDLNLIFKASLINTNIDRSLPKSNDLPKNFRLRVSGPNNLQHFSEFDGKQLWKRTLKNHFYPYYWKDFN
jgi:hypothetical protein